MTFEKKAARRAGSMAALGLAARTASQVMTFVLLLLAGRFLTIELFGVFALAVILLNLGQTLLYTGIYNFVLKEPDVEDSIGTAFTMQCVMALLFGGIILGAYFLVREFTSQPVLAELVLATAPLPIIGLIGCWQESVALRVGKVRFYYLSTLTSEVAGFVTGAALLVMGYGVWALIISRYVAAVAFSLMISIAGGGLPRPEFKLSHARRILKYAYGLYGGAFLTFFSNYGADVVIGAFLNTRAVGLFRMGTRTATAAFDVFAHTARVLSWQVVGRLSREGRTDDPIWLRMYGVVFAVILGALGSMAVLGEELALTALGPDWLPMVPILQAVCLVRVIATFDVVATAQLAAADQTAFLFRMRIIEALMLAVALFVGVQFGEMGVALSLFPSAIFLFVVLLRRTMRLTDTSFGLVAKELASSTCVAAFAILPAFAVQHFVTGFAPWEVLLMATGAGLAGLAVALIGPYRRWTIGHAKALSMALVPEHQLAAAKEAELSHAEPS